jgi:hypothetical protein
MFSRGYSCESYSRERRMDLIASPNRRFYGVRNIIALSLQKEATVSVGVRF